MENKFFGFLTAGLGLGWLGIAWLFGDARMQMVAMAAIPVGLTAELFQFLALWSERRPKAGLARAFAIAMRVAAVSSWIACAIVALAFFALVLSQAAPVNCWTPGCIGD